MLLDHPAQRGHDGLARVGSGSVLHLPVLRDVGCRQCRHEGSASLFGQNGKQVQGSQCRSTLDGEASDAGAGSCAGQFTKVRVVNDLLVFLEPRLVMGAISAGGAVEQPEVAEDRLVALVESHIDGDGIVTAPVGRHHGARQEAVTHRPVTTVQGADTQRLQRLGHLGAHPVDLQAAAGAAQQYPEVRPRIVVVVVESLVEDALEPPLRVGDPDTDGVQVTRHFGAFGDRRVDVDHVVAERVGRGAVEDLTGYGCDHPVLLGEDDPGLACLGGERGVVAQPCGLILEHHEGQDLDGVGGGLRGAVGNECLEPVLDALGSLPCGFQDVHYLAAANGAVGCVDGRVQPVGGPTAVLRPDLHPFLVQIRWRDEQVARDLEPAVLVG